METFSPLSPGAGDRSSRTPAIITAILALCFLLAMHIYQPNMGGTGLSLPLNITTWIAMISVVLVACARGLRRHQWVIPPALKWLLLAAVLYSLPLVWSEQAIWQRDAIPRVLGLWGGIAFYFALMQVALTPRARLWWSLLVLIAVLEEAGLSLLQLWVFETPNWMEYRPSYGRPYGIFQQINVLASFLATGYALAILLWLRSRKRVVRSISALAMLVLPFLLVTIQSRIGWLGALVIFVGYCLLQHRNKAMRAVVLLSLAGVAGALLFEWFAADFVHIEKDGSDVHRLMMLRVAIEMIAARPLSGWGYGGFSWQTAHFLGHTLDNARLVHPHNELLFGWVEGGIAALLAMLLIGWAVLMPLFTPRWRQHLLLWLPLLPIALHTMTEYPLYQSALHWMTLIVLYRLATPDEVSHLRVTPRWLLVGVNGFGVVAALLILPFLTSGYVTQAQLTTQERSGLRDNEAIANVANRWITPSRQAFDYHVSQLQRFNQTQDPQLLEAYRRWGREYVLLRNQPEVYRDLIAIARYQQRAQEAAALLNEAQGLFPDDPQFMTSGQR